MQEALGGREKDLIGRGIAGLALGEIVVECDGLHVLPPLEEGRTPQFCMSSSEEGAHCAIPSFYFALGLRMPRSAASDLVAKASGILGDPIVSVSAVTDERARAEDVQLKFAAVIAVNDNRDSAPGQVLEHLGPDCGSRLVLEKVDLHPAREVVDDDHEVALGALLPVHVGMEVLEIDDDALTEGATDDRMNVLAATHRLRLSAVRACADHDVAFSLCDTMEVFVELRKGSGKGKGERSRREHTHQGKRSRLAVMTRTMDRNDKRRLGVWWDEDFIVVALLSPNHDWP